MLRNIKSADICERIMNTRCYCFVSFFFPSTTTLFLQTVTKGHVKDYCEAKLVNEFNKVAGY